MAGMETATAAADVRADSVTTALKRPPRSLWRDAWYQFRRHRLAMAGMAVLVFLIIATLSGPLL